MNQAQYIPNWEQAMRKGLINGRPYSEHTVSQYLYHIHRFLDLYETITLETIRQALLDIPVEQFGKRDKLYKAIVCFLKYLLDMGYPVDSKLLDAEGDLSRKVLKKLSPKRHIPPERKCITEEQLQAFLAACKNPLDRLIVVLLSSTGLRASEACDLNLADIDFQQQIILVRKGKWGKIRRVGLTDTLIQVIHAYLRTRSDLSPSSPLMLNAVGGRMDRFGLSQRVERLGKQAEGIPVNPHALRRAFVTINVKKGRPLRYLQIACGHNSIVTTETYCRTQEQEVIDAMKDWE